MTEQTKLPLTGTALAKTKGSSIERPQPATPSAIARLCAQYLEPFGKISDNTKRRWIEALSAYPEHLLLRGFRELVKTYKYGSMPKPGNVTELIDGDYRRLMKRWSDAKDAQRWAEKQLEPGINDYDQLTDDERAELHGQVQAAITRISEATPLSRRADIAEPVKLQPIRIETTMGPEWTEWRRRQAMANISNQPFDEPEPIPQHALDQIAPIREDTTT